MTNLHEGDGLMTLGLRRDPPWAELRVLRGAPPRAFVFDGAFPAHHIVGSGPDATVVFAVRGVAPHHFAFVWDGQNIWLEDTLRLGRTVMSGKPLNEWTFVLGTAIVNFGAASLAIRAEGSAPSQTVPDFTALEHARLFDTGPIRKRDTQRIVLPRKAGGES